MSEGLEGWGCIEYEQDAGYGDGQIAQGDRGEHRLVCWSQGRYNTDRRGGCLVCWNLLDRLFRVIKETDVIVIRAS